MSMTEIDSSTLHRLVSESSRFEKAKEKATETMGHVLQAVEIGGAALAFGYANQRYGTNGELQILGVPADLVSALGLHAFSLVGGFGKYAEHGHNLGDGALASYAFRMGSSMGAKAALGQPLLGSTPTAQGWYVPGGPSHAHYVNAYARG